MCLKTTMSKYFRNSCSKGERKKKKKEKAVGDKKGKARIFFRGKKKCLFTQSLFLEKGGEKHSSVKAEHSKGCEMSCREH